MRQVKTATFDGTRYKIEVKPVLGLCDSPKTNPGKPGIWVIKGLKNDKATLDTLIHEALHAANWSANHKKINQTAGDLSRFLWRLGYRLTKEK